MINLKEIREAIITGRPDDAKDLAQKALQGGGEADKILNETLIPAINEVGEKFGLTRERIRQIESEALKRLRHPRRSRKLRNHLD